jgi:hypothetical protein
MRELLGHGSMAMTHRYAHLAPAQKREAVAKPFNSDSTAGLWVLTSPLDRQVEAW